MGLFLIWTWSIMCQFQCKDFIPMVSSASLWNHLHFHLLSGFWVMSYINNKHFPYLREAIKNQNMHRGQKMSYDWGTMLIEITLITFLKSKWNLEVVPWFEKCLSLFGNRIKQERIYHCEMTNRLVLILLNPTTT